MSDHSEINAVNGNGAGAGFDKDEPKAGMIAILGVITVVSLVVVLIAVQAYFNHVRADLEYENVLVPKAEDLQALRAREDQQLNSYRYVDRTKGTVRLPIDRAMDLLVKEAAEDKLPYSTKPAEIKPDEPVVVAGANAPTTAK